tara:strand:- start:3168 stop:3995 length:828 start_codon:yes stop_codon:yes gene_type:complete
MHEIKLELFILKGVIKLKNMIYLLKMHEIKKFEVKKKISDFLISLLILILISPLILVFCLVIFLYDKQNPFYISTRVGLKGKVFKIFKIRTMIINADKIGGTSTKSSDSRLLPVGKLIRKLKLDELAQLFNILNDSMALVGPRPNTTLDVSYYSNEELKLLEVKPGITDFSSIIFADEGEILDKYDDPDIAYNQLIRPWKSRLGLFYIQKKSNKVDFALIFLTFINIFNRKKALYLTSKLIAKVGGSNDLINIALRKKPLTPSIPPGFDEVISNL